MAPLTMLPIEIGPRVLPESQLSPKYVKVNFSTWVPGLHGRQVIEQALQTVLSRSRTILFEVDTVALPTATSRWVVNWPGHPEVTFDDLRAGRFPKFTEPEIASWHHALELAREIRPKLDIRPLTTAAIIRMLREGGEE